MTFSRRLSRRFFQTALVASAAALAAGYSIAQTFPDKPMRIVVGAPAGGTADILGRVLAEGLSAQLGQPVIVDNKPGAAGILGLQELLKSPRDGHTLMIAVNGLVSEIPHVVKMPVDPLKELRPLAELGRTGLLMVGSPQLSATNVKEAIAYIKANPGKVSYASYSTGTMSHTIGLEFNKLAGTDMLHVGYKGSPPALTDVAGGHVAFMFDGPATSIPMIKGGKIKVFATTAPTRMKALPDVPTFAELGYKDLTEVVWMGLWVTPDVPAAAQTKLRDAVMKVLQLPATRERFAGLGLEPGSNATPDELIRGLRVAFDRQAAQLKAIGFKPE
ncbi:MAG: tripartite tricarboxylate transporter substrate binding protein [Rhodoferax sp.]|uniref:Bug family tripartite tricarboxylate transporter substrate binding protein n=1 Tax=Rhodoferax sp. TaxID=50421 RepID=UPI002727E36D|nr:tripartite tricarboxylate transporter substrate binding protein [Rhodoferax sp.]MDO8447905.1 tripartite tricarboxylate transporter substrate binding protein [Rhodoferax sp.]